MNLTNLRAPGLMRFASGPAVVIPVGHTAMFDDQ
jgi:hypothetical protein